MIGTRLGPYDVVAKLGEGGMGEVYRAHDSKLGRDVALKVLPERLLDSERLARFRREAQVVAALNHPNIAAIYGFEEAGDRPALVLELVEGPTLADRIAQGPLPQDEAVAIARQIAEALEAAHEQGVIHRDLKPANIKLRPDGVVKVLDFGLAKLSEPGIVSGRVDPTLSPTITSPAATGIGVILGTAAYMAPEQAAGKQADKRADIWGFGVVLWEMLTGERLFGSGETTSHVLADVLRAPVDFDKIPAGPLRELLRRCLDRDVKTRLRDIGEARVALSRPTVASVAREETDAPRRVTLALAVAVAVLALSTVLALWAPWRALPERPLVRLDVDLGADVALPADARSPSAMISPDGSRLLYLASLAGGPTRVFIRRLDQDHVTELTGTDGVVAAAFSPDSRSVAFVAGNRVYTMPSEGGAVHRLAEVPNPPTHIVWADGGTIVLSGGIAGGLWRIPATGGEPVRFTELEKSEASHARAHVLPGAKDVLFSVTDNVNDIANIETVPMAGGERRVVVRDGVAAQYLPTGHLLFLRQSTLFAVRFDLDSLELRGDPVPMVTDIMTTLPGRVPVGSFSVGGDGTLVYRRATGPAAAAAGAARVDLIDAKGARSPLISTPGNYGSIRFSPDGSQLALHVGSGLGGNVFVYSPRRDSLTQVSFDGGREPAWTRPDGRYLLFGRDGIFWTRPGGQPQRLLPEPASMAWSVAPNGRIAHYMPQAPSDGRPQAAGASPGGARIFTAPLTEEGDVLNAGPPEPFSPPQYDEYEAEFSPDGRWMAFTTDRTGRFEVMVRAFPPPASGQAYLISNNGGREPRWSRTARELLYVEGDRLMAVSYTVKGDVFEAQRPHMRVEKFGSREWDLAPDGRIAVVTPIAAESATSAPPAGHAVVFLQRFADEVRRRVK